MRLTLAMAVACLSIVRIATADPAPAAIRQQTEIPAQGLGPALTLLAKEFDFQVLYRTEVVGSLRTRGVSGPMTAAEALEHVLSGTGLTYKYLDEKTVTIMPVEAPVPSSRKSQLTPQSSDPGTWSAQPPVRNSAAEPATTQGGADSNNVSGMINIQPGTPGLTARASD